MFLKVVNIIFTFTYTYDPQNYDIFGTVAGRTEILNSNYYFFLTHDLFTEISERIQMRTGDTLCVTDVVMFLFSHRHMLI